MPDQLSNTRKVFLEMFQCVMMNYKLKNPFSKKLIKFQTKACETQQKPKISAKFFILLQHQPNFTMPERSYVLTTAILWQ